MIVDVPGTVQRFMYSLGFSFLYIENTDLIHDAHTMYKVSTPCKQLYRPDSCCCPSDVLSTMACHLLVTTTGMLGMPHELVETVDETPTDHFTAPRLEAQFCSSS